MLSRQKYSIVLEKRSEISHGSFYIYIYILKYYSKNSDMLKYSKFSCQILIYQYFYNNSQIFIKIVRKKRPERVNPKYSGFISFAFKMKWNFFTYQYIYYIQFLAFHFRSSQIFLLNLILYILNFIVSFFCWPKNSLFS